MARPLTLTALLLLGALLSGCSSNDSGDAASSSSSTTTGPASNSTTTGGPGSIALPPSAAEFQIRATGCYEFIVLAPIEIAAARRFVPAGYAIAGQASGRAVAFGGLKHCQEVLIDGVSIGSASTSDVGVNIDSPDGSDGNHYYQTWWLTDNPKLAERLTAQGWRGNLTNTTISVSFPAGEQSFRVDWSEGAYSGRGTSVSGDVPPALTFTGWHDHVNGTVAVRKTLTSTEFGTGTGVLTATGPMADLMGASASGTGILNVYAMTGTVGPRTP